MNKFISDYIKNNTKTVFLGLSVPQKKNMRAMLYRIFETGSGILRELGDGGAMLPKSRAQKFARHLGNIDLETKVEDYADRAGIPFMYHNMVIAYDLTDIAKPSAKKIEGIGGIFDGSKRKQSKGFFVHGVGFGKFLLRLRLHNGDETFLPQVRKEILEKLIPKTKSFNPVFAFDRGNDSQKLFEYLNKKSTRFIIRLKKNRSVIIRSTGEKVSVKSLIPGKYLIFLESERTKQKKKKEYLKFILIIQKNKSFKTPMYLLCSENLDNFTNQEITNLYLQRWGVENAFKQIKQGLSLEQIRVLSFVKFKNFVSLMHLSTLLNEILLKKIQINLKTFKNLHLSLVWEAYENFRKRHSRTTNSHSFLCFLRTIIPTFCVHRKRPPRPLQASLFRFRGEKVRTF